jgi:uncharacterized protein (DUF1684 family)
MTAGDDFETAHAEWRATRIAKLAADTGWLNLAGRWWITPGRMSVGSGAENDIRLASGPGTLGRLTLRDDDTGVFEPVGGTAVDLDRAGNRWSWRVGQFLMEITALNDLRALRVRDVERTMPADRVSIDFFPLDPALRVKAAWEALPEPVELILDTIIGIPTRVPVTHSARLTLAGHPMVLLPTYGTADRPQFVFRDLTSLDDTYAKGRFVFGEEVTEDGVVIDFNRAINPPCAFTEHAVCPLPPRENLFWTRIEAGERRLPG